MIKKASFFVFILFIWFIPLGFASLNNNIYINNNTLLVICFINNLFLLFSVYKILVNYSINNSYLFILVSTYLVNPLFYIFFYNYSNIILSLFSLVIILFSSIYLFIETKKLSSLSSIWIIPYIVLNSFLIITLIYICFLF